MPLPALDLGPQPGNDDVATRFQLLVGGVEHARIAGHAQVLHVSDGDIDATHLQHHALVGGPAVIAVDLTCGEHAGIGADRNVGDVGWIDAGCD